MRFRPRNTITSRALQDSVWKDTQRLRVCGLSMKVHISNPSLGKSRREHFKVKASLNYLMGPYQKQPAEVIHTCNPSTWELQTGSGAQSYLIYIANLKLAYAKSLSQNQTKPGAKETAVNNVFTM